MPNTEGRLDNVELLGIRGGARSFQADRVAAEASHLADLTQPAFVDDVVKEHMIDRAEGLKKIAEHHGQAIKGLSDELGAVTGFFREFKHGEGFDFQKVKQTLSSKAISEIFAPIFKSTDLSTVKSLSGREAAMIEQAGKYYAAKVTQAQTIEIMKLQDVMQKYNQSLDAHDKMTRLASEPNGQVIRRI